jgi:predicted NUDIX family NTP pyrophosphohydrolase
VLIALPGGPYFAGRDEGWWTVPKGEHEPDEEPLEAARREFAEELGSPPPDGELLDLGSVSQRGGKVVRAFAVEGDLDTSSIVSNEFELEWPPRSGLRRSFPEIARAEWVSLVEARRKLLAAQIPFLDRLEAALGGRP